MAVAAASADFPSISLLKSRRDHEAKEPYLTRDQRKGYHPNLELVQTGLPVLGTRSHTLGLVAKGVN
jgi:hypothetical protein